MPIFRVKSVKIYTGQKKFTLTCPWRPWQIWGMSWLRNETTHRIKSIWSQNFLLAVLRWWWGFCWFSHIVLQAGGPHMKSESFDENGIKTKGPLQTFAKITICNIVNWAYILKWIRDSEHEWSLPHPTFKEVWLQHILWSARVKQCNAQCTIAWIE